MCSSYAKASEDKSFLSKFSEDKQLQTLDLHSLGVGGPNFLYLPVNIHSMELAITKTRYRIESIDILRGFIMLIMALDHVRDFVHVDAITGNPTDLTTTTPALFFTRWITHYCAPLFLFLSGISASLSGQRRSKKELSLFLIKRGLWLVFVEIFIMTLILTFNPAYNIFLLAVIWAIGWSMVILGLLIHTSYTTILIVGILFITAHNITDLLPPVEKEPGLFFYRIFLTTSGVAYTLGSRAILFGYAIIPWAGIMFLGFAFGKLYSKDFDAARRKKILLTVGFSLIALFVILRFINSYGDPRPWSHQKDGLFTFLSFLNTTKYPVSLMFTCMTLGPAMIFLALFENVKGAFVNFLKVYGKVPLFYFAGHFLLAHIICVILFFAMGHSTSEIVDPRSPLLFRPAEFGVSLGYTYLVWLSVILLMYYPCKWYGRYKETHSEWWISYL